MTIAAVYDRSTTNWYSWYLTEKEGVASFLRLLTAMLDGHVTNQQDFFLSEGPATIGSLLQKVHPPESSEATLDSSLPSPSLPTSFPLPPSQVAPSRLTVQTLSAIQALIEQFSDSPEKRHDLFKHLLFDYRIWSRPEFAVRIGGSNSIVVCPLLLNCLYSTLAIISVLRIVILFIASVFTSIYSMYCNFCDSKFPFPIPIPRPHPVPVHYCEGLHG